MATTATHMATQHTAHCSKSLPEACRPRTSLGVLFPDVEVASLRAWMAGRATTGPALATASAGSGLTTLVQLLLAETGLESVWIGCGTQRVKALLQNAGANPLSVTMRRKMIVIDEFDALASGDASAAADAIAFARSHPPLPVLFLSHATRSQKTLEFAKTWPRFAFARPSRPVLAAYLQTVAARHGIALPEGAVDTLARDVRGDVRAALAAMDLARRGPGPPPRQPPPAAGPSGSDQIVGRRPATADDLGDAEGSSSGVESKDEATEGLDLAEAVLRGQRGLTVGDGLKMFWMESASVVSMGMFENYLSALSGGADVAAAAEVADAYSVADVVDRYLYSHQAWDLYDFYGVCAVAAPAVAINRRRRSPPNPALGISKFGSVWSKVYNMCAKTKQVRSLAAKYAEAGLQPLRPADLAWVRLCLRTALKRPSDESSDEEVRRLAWPLAAADVLSLARLDAGQGGSATWYKQAVHSRVKKILLTHQKKKK